MTSNLIKARTLEPMGRQVVVKRDIQDACQRADEIVAQADQQAAQIVTDAHKKAESLLSSARQDGYQSGAAQWFEALSAARKSRDEYIAANEPALLALAVRIAEKLIGEELQNEPAKVASVVREALRSVRRAKSFVVHVHPADAVLLNEHTSTLRSVVGPTREIEIVSNLSLSRGDCLIETDIGKIDARMETQLKNIEQTLTAKASS